MASLTLKTKSQTGGDGKQKNVDQKEAKVTEALNDLTIRGSQHHVRGAETIKELERQRDNVLVEAAKCMKKGTPNYNMELAKKYYANSRVLQGKIDQVKISIANSQLLMATAKSDSYLSESANFMTSLSKAQKSTAESVNLNRVERTADRIADTRNQLDQASKTVNGALDNITAGMLRGNLEEKQDTELDSQIRVDPTMDGFGDDFLLWSQQQISSSATSVPSFEPGSSSSSRQEEPAYMEILKTFSKKEHG